MHRRRGLCFAHLLRLWRPGQSAIWLPTICHAMLWRRRALQEEGRAGVRGGSGWSCGSACASRYRCRVINFAVQRGARTSACRCRGPSAQLHQGQTDKGPRGTGSNARGEGREHSIELSMEEERQ